MTRLNSGVIVLSAAALLLAVPSAVAFAQRPNETTASGGGRAGGSGAGTAGGGGAAVGGGSNAGSAVPSSGSSSGGSSWTGGSSSMPSGSGGSGSYGESRRGASQRTPRANETTAMPASPWYSRPRGNSPATGAATVRTTPTPGTGSSGGSNGVDYTPYGSNYGYPTGYYGNYGWGYGPYGWGGFGLYSSYYDPFWSGYGGYPGYGYGSSYGYGSGYGYGGGYGGGGGWSTPPGYASQQRPEGSVRLKVKPANATVYVDGYYSGRVDDFDGIFQKLRLEPGPHKIEISAPGFKSLSFEVNIRFGETINFQGELEIIR